MLDCSIFILRNSTKIKKQDKIAIRINVKLLELSSKFGKNISFLKHQKSTKEVRNHRLNSVFVLELLDTALESSIFDRSLSSSIFQSLARLALMRAGQAKWDSSDTGRFTRSIL
jgi:hypothetical protein